MSHSELLADLVARLRAADFQIAPDDYLRAVHVTAQSEELPVERLGSLLGPLFADTRQQQDRFGEIFNELITPRVVEPVQPAVPAVPPRRTSYLVGAFLFTLAMFAVAAIAWRLSRPPVDSPPSPPTPPTTARQGFHWVGRQIVQLIAGRELNPTFLALAVAAALLLALSVLMLIRARRQTRERAPEAGPPYAWRLKPGGHPVLFNADDIGRLSRALRGKTESESLRLDLQRTIAGAARNPAAAELVYSAALKTPEYIVLIEKRSERDHHAAFFDQLTTLLAADGVDLQRFYFGYDPRVCWSSSTRRRTKLADLHRRSADARLILFGSPPALFDPINGTVNARVVKELRWPMQAIVSADTATLTVPSIHSASGSDALVSLGEYFSGGYRPKKSGAREPLLAAVDDARQAKQHLSPAAWRWLLACAAYPRLQWELTTALGMAICGAELPHAVRELIALPWFRDGEIPDRERHSLVEALQQDKALEQIARTVILDILGKTSLPDGSFASREKALQMITQEVWLHRDDQPRLRLQLGRLKQYRIAEIGRDSSLLRLLLTAPGSRVASRVPHLLRRLWYHSGIPAMGRREIRGLPVAGCVMAAFIALSVNFGPAEWMTRTSQTKSFAWSHTVYDLLPDETSTTATTETTQTTETMGTFSTSGTTTMSSSTDLSSTETASTDTFATDTFGTMATSGTMSSTETASTMLTETTATSTMGTAAPCPDETAQQTGGSLTVTLCGEPPIKPGETVTLVGKEKALARVIRASTVLGNLILLLEVNTSLVVLEGVPLVMETESGTHLLQWIPSPTQESNTRTIYFEYDSSTLTADAQMLVAEIAKRLSANPKATVTIVGYADFQESKTSRGVKIGTARAYTVRDYLTKYGIDEKRTITSGGVRSNAAEPNPEESARERVVIVTWNDAPTRQPPRPR